MFTFWHVHESLFGELVLLEISLVKLDAALKNLNELIAWIKIVVPKNIVTLWCAFLAGLSLSDSSEVEDGELAIGDHLVGDLSEQAGHSLVGVIVSGDGVDHLDTVHQSWESLFDGIWISIIKWLNEFLESLEILNVILGFVQSLGYSKLDCSPS